MVEGIFELGSKFWVKVISKEINEQEWLSYYQKIDKNSKINKDKLLIFLAGVTNPNGEEYTMLDKPFNIYIQYPDDWPEDLKAIFISENNDENIYVQITELNYPEGKTNFAALKLNHFSPYAIYEEVELYKVVFEANGGTLNS